MDSLGIDEVVHDIREHFQSRIGDFDTEPWCCTDEEAEVFLSAAQGDHSLVLRAMDEVALHLGKERGKGNSYLQDEILLMVENQLSHNLRQPQEEAPRHELVDISGRAATDMTEAEQHQELCREFEKRVMSYSKLDLEEAQDLLRTTQHVGCLLYAFLRAGKFARTRKRYKPMTKEEALKTIKIIATEELEKLRDSAEKPTKL